MKRLTKMNRRQEFKEGYLDHFEEKKLNEHIAWQHLDPIQIAQLLRFYPELRQEYEGEPARGD